MPSKVKAISLAVLLGFSGSVLAGLGNVQVHSRLGEPFYAVIPLTGQTAKDAVSPELSSQADSSKFSIQGSAAAGKLDFKIVRKNKNAYVQIKSLAPINEPLLTFGVKVSTNSGTVSRQYTAMLDPRGYEVSKAGTGNKATSTKGTVKDTSKAVSTTSKSRTTGRNVYVEEGDTLSSIAARFKPARMSLANTRRAIFLANPNAFIGGNPTKLKKGVTLRIPTEAKMRSLISASARKTTRPIKQAQVKGSTGSSNVTAPTTPVNDAQVAELRAQLSQAQTRIAKLEKELQDAKNTPKAKSDTTSDENKPAVEPKADAKTKPVADGKLDVKPDAKPDEMHAKGPEVPVDVASKVEIPEVIEASEPIVSDVVDVTSSEEVSPVVVEEPPKPKPRPPMPEPEPIPEPSLLDSLLENPLLPIGGLAVVLGGAGAYILRKRRKNKALETESEEYDDETFFNMNEMEDIPSSVPPAVSAKAVEKSANANVSANKQAVANVNQVANNVKASVGAAEDSKVASTFMSDFTRMSAAIDSVEIDPLSEAEVYIAYGRTDEAEEILKDALSKDPAQHEVRKKLLEIYASRQEIAPFAAMAKELYDAFDGRGALWQEVSAMGRQLDPNNSLYAEKGAPAAPQASESTNTSEVDEDLDMDFGSFEEPEKHEESSNSDIAFSNDSSMDFTTDLNFSTSLDAAPEATEIEEIHKETQSNDHELSFDLDSNEHGLEFDLDAVLNDAKDSGTLDDSVSDVESFDFNELDSGNNNFSLDDSHFEDDPAAAKLELARVYLDMGDADGAKEALTELLEETENPALRAEAREMLDKITS